MTFSQFGGWGINGRSYSWIAAIVFALPATGQNRVGNGGNVVLCESGSSQLLDFFEHETKPALQDGDYKKILEARLAALEKKDAALANQYLRRWSELQGELSIREDIDLISINDSHHLVKPAGKDCKIVQAVVRKALAPKSEPRFLVDAKVWNRLDGVQRAGLVFHEMVYEHFWKLGEKDSVRARSFVAKVFSPDFESTTESQYWKFIEELKVPHHRK